MTRQVDYERIKRVVVEPMCSTWQCKLPESMVEAFIEDLSGFSDDVLRAAFLEVRRTCKARPQIAHFVEVCRKLGGSGDGDTESAETYLRSLRKRDYDALTMAKQHQEAFASTELARSAKAENWDRPLLAYVLEAALLQARYISRSVNPGFNGTVLSNHRNLTSEESERRCRDFVASCKRQAATGSISVDPPTYLIDEWRPRAA